MTFTNQTANSKSKEYRKQKIINDHSEVGGSSTVSSILILFVPLLARWVLYAAFSYTVELKKRQEAYI